LCYDDLAAIDVAEVVNVAVGTARQVRAGGLDNAVDILSEAVVKLVQQSGQKPRVRMNDQWAMVAVTVAQQVLEARC